MVSSSSYVTSSHPPITAISLPSFSGATLFTPISAPILRSVDPVQVSHLLKERERYEVEVNAKKGEIRTISHLPYTASIDGSLLKSLFYMGKFDMWAPKETNTLQITNQNIKYYVQSIISTVRGTTIDPSVIEKTFLYLSMPLYIADPKARITHFFAEFFECLEAVGCGYFRKTNPKLTVKLML